MSTKDAKSVKQKTGADLRAQAEARLAEQVAAVAPNTPRQQLDEHKETVRRGLRSFVEVGTALGLIAKQKLYKEDGYATFDEFVAAEFEVSRAWAYRAIDAARVITQMSQVETNASSITNQAQALELAPIVKSVEAMARVVEVAKARGPLTADLLKAVRIELFPNPKVIEGEVVPDRAELEAPKSPLVEAMKQAIEEAQSAAADVPEDAADGGEGALTAPVDPPASGPSASPPVDGLDVTPEDEAVIPLRGIPSDLANAMAAAAHTTDTPAAEHPSPGALVAGQSGPHHVHIESRFAPKGAPDCFSTGGDRPQARLSDITCPACRGWLAGDGADFVDRWRRGGALLEDSSPEGSGEAPAGIEGTSIEEGPAVATSRPGIDHPLPQVGEARADASPLGAGVPPLPELGEGTGSDEVEGEAEHSPSTDQPVVIRASVEQMLECVEYAEIPRATWESMTPAERRAWIDDFGAQTMNNAGGYGSGIESGAPDSDLDDDEPSTDPASELVAEVTDLVHRIDEDDRFDADVLGPLLTAGQLDELHGAVEQLAHFVGLLERWRTP